tara:strand:+ start:327 stop:1043 length:717 start_codon:yes stop_codon:yes gene_type:complete
MVKKKGKSKKKKLSKKEIRNKQVMWTVVLMASLILIIVLVPFIFRNVVNKFTYINLDFQKTRLGNNIYYSTRVPIVDPTGKILGSYAMNFKNDPRETSKVSSFLQEGLITFQKDNPVYITLYPEMETCGAKNFIALSDLTGFLQDFGGLEVKSGIAKKDYAEENNEEYITCKNTLNNTVIYMNSGPKTEITKVNENCYEIIYNNCEVLPATEKFMLVILEKYMSFFVKESNSFLNMFK